MFIIVLTAEPTSINLFLLQVVLQSRELKPIVKLLARADYDGVQSYSKVNKTFRTHTELSVRRELVVVKTQKNLKNTRRVKVNLQ